MSTELASTEGSGHAPDAGQAAIMPPPPAMASAWRAALPPLLLLLAAVLFLYRDTATAMVLIWSRSDTFAHAFLVPPISLWLIWRQRDRLALLAPQPAAAMLLPIAAVALVWLLGELVAANSATQLALTAMLVFSVPAVLGLRVGQQILFPLAFLFFSVPIGEFLMPTLIGWTADFTVSALRLTGIPVFREGNQFVIPTGRWSVVEACSGVRYLIASFMVGTLFGYLNYRSNKRRLIFAVVSIIVPVIANWLRAYMIVMLGHLSGNKLAVGADHLVYGWVFFGIVITMLFMIGARWSEPDAVPDAPVDAARQNVGPGRGARAWTVALIAALLVAAPHAALWAVARGEHAGTPQLILPATLTPAWQAQDAAPPDWVPIFQGPSAQAQRVYRHGTQTVGLHIAYYRQQRDDAKLVSSGNMLVRVENGEWNELSTADQTIALADRSITVHTAQLLQALSPGQTDRARLLVWKLYWVNGSWTSSDYLAKLAGAWHRLRGQGDESAAVIVYASEASAGEAAPSLQAFLATNLDALDALLSQVRASGRAP